MSTEKESVAKTLLVALIVSLVSAVFVAGAAVGLKPVQKENRQIDMQKSILQIAQLLPQGNANADEIKRIFNSQIEAKVVDLKSGLYLENEDPNTINPLLLASDSAQSVALSANEDIANIKRRENKSVVYWAKDENGTIQSLILPVRGYGLWSTLYGFLAIKEDLNTVVGLGFYQHGETPGLGGEVDNPKWKAKWIGKELFQGEQLNIHVIKGNVKDSDPDAAHKVDGLAGASLTSRGVNNLVNFWLGEQGFGAYLQQLRKGEA